MKKFILILLALLIISNQNFSQVSITTIKEGGKILELFISGPKRIPISEISKHLYGSDRSLSALTILQNSKIYWNGIHYSTEEAKGLGLIDYSTSTISFNDNVSVFFYSDNIEIKRLAARIDKAAEKAALNYNNNKPPAFINEKIGKYQWLLKNRNYYYKKIDGIIGPDTKMAIKAFQIDEGLTVTGELNKETKTLIDKYLNSNTTVSNLDLPIQKDELSEYYEILYRLGYLKEEVSNIYYVQNLTRPILDFQIENSLRETGRLNEETKKLLAQIKQEKEGFISYLESIGYEVNVREKALWNKKSNAITTFEKDFGLENTGIYKILIIKNKLSSGTANINFVYENSSDFLKVYERIRWKSEYKHCNIKTKICLDTNNSISFSFECNGRSIGISTTGNIKLSAQGFSVNIIE